jgi:hypothetical protein
MPKKNGEGAYVRYYSKNRDAIVARMRERYYAKRDADRAEAESNPDAVGEQKTIRHEKYLRGKQNGALKLLRETANKPILRPLAKQFIEQELIRPEAYRRLPLSAVRALCSALEYHKETPDPQQNGRRTEDRDPISALREETEEGEEEEAECEGSYF